MGNLKTTRKELDLAKKEYLQMCSAYCRLLSYISKVKDGGRATEEELDEARQIYTRAANKIQYMGKFMENNKF